MGVCYCSMFCCTLLYVHSSIAIILMGKRELIALLNLSSWCLVMVERLFLAVPRGRQQFVIVVFPDHTHLLFLHNNDCSHIEDVHLLFYAHFMNIFHFFSLGGGGGVLNLDIFSLGMLRWFLVCVICNSKSFYFLIFKLCIMIVHTLNMCLSFLCKFDKHFLIFRAVELRHFPSEMLRGCLVCVI